MMYFGKGWGRDHETMEGLEFLKTWSGYQNPFPAGRNSKTDQALEKGIADKASVAKKDVGGIDLNGIEVSKKGTAGPVHFSAKGRSASGGDQAQLQQILDQGIDGLEPVIVDFVPATLASVLGDSPSPLQGIFSSSSTL